MTGLALILGILLVFGGFVLWASRKSGEGASEAARAEREAARAASAEEQLEMNREADAFERKAAALSEDELDRRLTR